jgi:hypothetical protein
MTRRLLPACLLVLGLVLTLPEPARAGDVRLSIRDGRVALSAQDATLRQILLEWERVGGTRVFNRDRVPGTLLTIELTNVTEAEALATLLRSVAGYVATRRLDPAAGASRYSRIVLMPGEARPWAAAASVAGQPAAPSGPQGGGPGMGPGGGPLGRPPFQRRVLPDGRVVTTVDDGQRTGDADEPDDNAVSPGAPGLMRPPFGASSRPQQSQPGDDYAGQAEGVQGSASATAPKASPTAGASIITPGVLPATRTLSSTPIKPPGDE